MLHFYFFIFYFHLSGPLNNNKALYMKITVCINTLPQQCSSDLKKFFIPNTNQKHDVIDHISTKYRKCCKCYILYTRLKIKVFKPNVFGCLPSSGLKG